MSDPSRGASEHIRANRHKLVVVFIVAAAVTALVEAFALLVLQPSPALQLHTVLGGVVLVLVIGVVATLMTILAILGRLVPDTIPLNVIPSEDRQAVIAAVRTNDVSRIPESERPAALEYARRFEENTPLTFLQSGGFVVLFLLIACELALIGSGGSLWVPNVIIFIAVLTVTVSNFVVRLRRVRHVRDFIDAVSR